ncbi:MAG: phosphatidate cytidylyltransferase [Alphaproteobacteria bacterium]|nr:phosphatidate cytidylyltransferase [Alphaproteobacteria bacterium]MDE2630149.1 phosphatidate cytidylyltransferase [Alphaproteobacteria bacterium]
MSKSPDITATNRAPGLRTVKFSRDWVTRPIFGVVLALVVIAAIYGGTPYLAVVAAAAIFAAAREWHRIVGGGSAALELGPTAATICSALVAFVLWPHSIAPYVILPGGALLVLVLALSTARRSQPLWQAAGVLYLGIPTLALLALRELPAHGAWLIGALFAVVWATDTGALVVGNLLGGPRLAPVLSPNKTWSGAIGGLVAAAIAEAVFIAVIGGHAGAAALFGAVLAVFAHTGDLFESWVKRSFHIKDSGGLIPGHGGVLDRIDSTLAAVVALAVAVFVFHLDPLFGASP